MKKQIYLCIAVMLASGGISGTAALPQMVRAEVQKEATGKEDTSAALEKTDIFASQKETDQALLAEAKNGYSLEEALIVVDPYGTSPLTAMAVFSTEEEVGGTVTVKGKSSENDITGTFEAAKDHIVPIYGLYNGDTTTVEITLDSGESASYEVATEAVQADYGEIKAEVSDPDSYDYSNLTFLCSAMGSVYGVDAAGDIRFYTTIGGVLGVHQLENGHLMMPASYVLKTSYYKEGLIEVDLNGRIYREYAVPGGQHHDFRELPNGNLLVASDSPDLSSVEDYVVEIDRTTGEVVWELDMKDILDIEDGQSASMESDGSDEEDWFHNNGLWYDEANDLILLSARHKDAIVAVKKSDKNIAWILGDPTGWENTDGDLFFTLEGEDSEWFYAQHNVTMLDNGDIMLFDNGTAKVKRINNDDRVTGDDVYSRAVIYHIDTDAMTATQVYEYGKERGSDWYSDWISGVDSLDGTKDHLFITAGSHLHSDEENRSDFYPSDMFKEGLTKMTHIDQVDNGNLTYEITVESDTAAALTYRSFRLNMYGNGASIDFDTEPEVLGSLGETSYDTVKTDISSAEALPDGWNITLDDLKLSVQGTYNTEASAEELKDGSLILVNGNEQRSYDLTQSATAGDNGSSVSAKGWTSVDGLEGKTWDIYVAVDGKVYAAGSQLSL